MNKSITRGTEYGTSYFGIRDPKAAKSDLKRFAESGLNSVLHTFSERDQRYYQGTMREIISVSQEYQLTVYVNPWGVGNVFGGEALSEFIGRFPQARQQLSNGTYVPAACFNAPEFREFMQEWVRDAMETGADYLFWDEPHWYRSRFRSSDYPDEAWTCRCSSCRNRFKTQYGETMPQEQTDRVKIFQAESLFEFLQSMMNIETKNSAKNTLCIEPKSGSFEKKTNWDLIESLENLDVIGATPFWEFHDKCPERFVGEWTEQLVSCANKNDIRSQVWLQGFNLSSDRKNIQDLRKAIKAALKHSPDSIFLWGWDGCRTISSISCEDPEEIWKIFLEEINSYSGNPSPGIQ